MLGTEVSSAAIVVNSRNNRLWVNRGDARGRELIRTRGNVNPRSMQLWNLALGLHPWRTVVDVGSNFGEMIVGADLPAEADLVAVEADRAVLAYLRETLDRFDRPVTLIPMAVSDHEGTEGFVHDHDWSGNSGLARYATHVSANSELDTVPVTTLDELLGGAGLTSVCIKIDVEGAEAAVLRGAATLLETAGHWAVMVEILHMTTEQLSTLAGAFPLYLFDIRQGRLVHVHSHTVAALECLRTSSWLYPQDALIVSSSGLVPRG